MTDLQIGVPFRLLKDWKMLFAKDAKFQWQRRIASSDLILRRLSLINVVKFYFYQLAVRIVLAVTYPVLRLAHKFWNDIPEGEDTLVITERMLMTQKMPTIKFFRID